MPLDSQERFLIQAFNAVNTPTDKLIETYFTEDANALKTRSAKAFTIGIAAGLTAVISFTVCAAMVFLSALQLNPLSGVVSLLFGAFFGCVLLLSVPISWIFIGRFIYLRWQLARYINQQMTPNNA